MAAAAAAAAAARRGKAAGPHRRNSPRQSSRQDTHTKINPGEGAAEPGKHVRLAARASATQTTVTQQRCTATSLANTHTYTDRAREANGWMYGYSQVQGRYTFFSVNMKGAQPSSVFSPFTFSLTFYCRKQTGPLTSAGVPSPPPPAKGCPLLTQGGSRGPRCDSAATAIPTMTRSRSTAE